jgi:hypothetical protein
MSKLLAAVTLTLWIAGSWASQASGTPPDPGERGENFATHTHAGTVVSKDHSAQLNERARGLRAAIDSLYKSHAAAPAVANAPAGLNISSTVQKYIPQGTSLQDAEDILRLAGFRLSKSGPSQVQAQIQPYERGFLWTYSSSVNVLLRTVSRGGDQTVNEVFGNILKPAL